MGTEHRGQTGEIGDGGWPAWGRDWVDTVGTRVGQGRGRVPLQRAMLRATLLWGGEQRCPDAAV